MIGRRFEKVRSRRARQVRRWKGHKEEPLKQTVGNDPVRFLGGVCLGIGSWRTARCAMC